MGMMTSSEKMMAERCSNGVKCDGIELNLSFDLGHERWVSIGVRASGHTGNQISIKVDGIRAMGSVSTKEHELRTTNSELVQRCILLHFIDIILRSQPLDSFDSIGQNSSLPLVFW
jgi:hypothetical protein